ncbi:MULTISPECIES: hypothetical protein [unclassified Agrococcus]|uniref:hypothetical protein n=1 Tax=unclassified Agrococcus TaxID=2615065 RepID=UPI0036152AB9
MTETTERACVHGCTHRGEHFAQCPDYGRGDGDCRGCRPRLAHDASLICGRCFGQLRGAVDMIPDCVLAMESASDPQKAKEIKQRVAGSKDETPAPVRAEILDAYGEVMGAIVDGVEGLTGTRHRMPRLTDGADLVRAEAVWLASSIIQWLPEIANDQGALDWWWDVLLGVVVDEHLPEEQRAWTLQRALGRFRVAPYVRKSQTPCPTCEQRKVIVRQPRVAPGVTTYACTNQECDFERTDRDVDEPWPLIFEGYEGGKAA